MRAVLRNCARSPVLAALTPGRYRHLSVGVTALQVANVDVDDAVDGLSLDFAGVELPLSCRIEGVFVQLFVKTLDEHDFGGSS